MAAVTVDEVQNTVFGNLCILVGQIDIAANDDTYATGLSKIHFVGVTPTQTSTSQVGATISGGTITFKVGGAEANCKLLVIGEGQ